MSVKKGFRRRRRFVPAASFQPEPLSAILEPLLDAMGGGAETVRLCHLWRSWEHVLGPALAPFAFPLGHRADVLHVGCEDSMLMQELAMQQDEILERVNAFMEKKFFASVKISLVQGRKPLNCPGPAVSPAPCPLPPASCAKGRFLHAMDPDSPVAKCYARFVRNPK